MWFHLFIGNHDQLGADTLCDSMEWLVAGLTDLQHKVTIGDTIAPNAMNIIWENFYDSDERFFTEQQFNFGLIATEIPVGSTFNWLDHEPWLTRRRCFDRIAPRAQFIWSMVEEPVTIYRQWAPCGLLELGFSEKILDPIFSQEPEFDFGFYGLSITPYRREILQRLERHCLIAKPDRFLKGHDLNRFIASFKVGICLKHMPQWPIPSPARLSRLLHAKRAIAAEYTPVQTGPSAFVATAGKDRDFADYCLECVRGPWKRRAEEAYEGFRAAMPMKDIMERLLDETVSMRESSARMPSADANALAAADDGLRDWLRFQAAEPRLVGSHGDFNFVQYKSRVYAISQRVGPLDVAVEAPRLVERFGPEAVIVADTIDEARAQVDARVNPMPDVQE